MTTVTRLPPRRIAITREPGPGITRCELTHLPRRPIDLTVARAQHRRYEETLCALGCDLWQLPPDSSLPDAVFVEDTAVVFDELAVVALPGAASRRPETAATAAALAPYRSLVAIVPPGTLDGGDVMRIGRTVYVGRSGRTNAAAIAQLTALLAPQGYAVRAVPVRGCLHLKSAVTPVALDTVLCNPRWIDSALLTDVRVLEVDPTEPSAANGLLVGERVVYPVSFPFTRRRLEEGGIAVVSVDVSELQKAEGAVTCCSIIFEPRPLERARAVGAG